MDNMLIYYGWLNSFNSAQNQWNNEKVAQEISKYDLVVLGDGIQDPNHGDYANTQVIIPRIMELNPEASIFGYVTVNQNLSSFKTKVDQWDDLKIDGIFMDEAGYDYGKKRSEFNECVIHVKSKENANVCFANAWNIDHVLGTADDPSYPNSTYNPDGYESMLDEDDWYLLESFAVNTDSYQGDYAPKADWIARGNKAAEKALMYGVGMAGCNIINDDNANGQNMFDFCHRAAQMFDLDANGSSDSSYGASSAKSKFWTRPDPKFLSVVEGMVPSVTADIGDADVYLRYADHCCLKLDWSSGSETSSAEQW